MSVSSVFPYHDKDLSAMPRPDVLEALDYETLLAERKAMYNGLMPLLLDESGQPTVRPATLIQTERETFWKIPVNDDAGLFYLDLESDPSTRHLQQDAYVEMWFRNRVNQASLANMPAYAAGKDLDHIALRYGVHRLTTKAETDSTPATQESDDAFRKRVLLAIEGFARGGSTGWYLFNTLSADGRVKDAHVSSPSPCEIMITVLSHEADGTASDALLSAIRDHINSRNVRVLGDRITVQSAEVVHYSLGADIHMYNGPSAETVMSAIRSAFKKYRAQSERIGHWITESGVYEALHQTGVYRVVVNKPSLPLKITEFQAAYCDALNLKEVRDGV